MIEVKDNKVNTHDEFWKKLINKDIKKSSFSNKIMYKDSVKYSDMKFMVPEEITREILRICNNSNIGIYIYMISAVQYILKVYSGNDDVAIGIDAIAKEKSNIEQCDKILIFKSNIKEEYTFKEFLSESKEMFVSINKFNYLDIQYIQKISGIEEFDKKTAIIDTIVRLTDINKNNELKGFDVSTIFEFQVEENNISFNIKYNVDLIDSERIETIASHLINFLSEVVISPDTKLKMIDIASEEEKNKIISFGAGEKAYFNENETINDLFEKQVEKTPNNVAIVFEDKKLTYKELNERSNQLANVLRKRGIRPNDIVGIMTERSLEMIIGIIGILKAGGAYLPINPEYPKDRIEYMLEDSSAHILLTKKDFINKIEFIGEAIDLCDKKLYSGNKDNLKKVSSSSNLSYIIYTSGTTGKPKGVMIEHRNVVKLLYNGKVLFDFNDNDIWTMFHSFCFDFSVWEMYGALLYGGKLVIVSKIIAQDTRRFLKLLKKENITILNQVPSTFLNLIYEEIKLEKKELKIRYVIFGGEALKPIILKQWVKKYPETRLINMYGITETTVHVTFKEITIEDISLNISNIGRPIPTLNTYIMDKNMKLLPIGVSGELCISGAGLARGYLNKPELTQEKFISNPYEPGKRMYRTGDLARWLPDGNIEFLGRMDHQVKIRGFRIEIGEIEKNLLYNDKIKEAVVIDRADELGNKYLCAYLVTNSSLTVKELREELGEKLPDYMIPSYFIEIDEIPLNNNGKMDRKALIGLDGSINIGSVYEVARNKTEEKLIEIWTDALKLKNIGIKDNFFDLGGNSLNAMVLVSKIQKNFKVNILITDILELMTIENISKYIDTNINKYSYKSLINVDKREFYPVSSSQKRMFILQNLSPLDIAYNDQLVKIIKGKLDIKKLEESFISLIKRHEALRTSFILNKDEVVQIINDNINFNIEIIEQDNKNIDDLIADFVQPFDLSKAPLMRVGIIKGQECSYLMIFDIHHICMDAITMKILTNELSLLYNGEMLPSIEFQYKDFACWQKDLLQTPLNQTQKEYWYNNLNNYNFKSNIFNKCNLTYKNDGRLKRTKFSIGNTLKLQLEHLGNSNEVTLYVILLTAYSILLYRFSGEEDIIIGTPIAGRHHPNLDKIVGVFINTLPVRIFPDCNKTVRELLNEVKETMNNLFKNQDYPFDDIVNDLNSERSENKNPLFNTMFALNSINYKKLNLSGVEVIDYDVNKSGLMMDILLEAEILNNELNFTFEYNDMIFSKKLVDKFMYNYIKILRSMIVNKDIRIQDIYLDEFLI